MSSDPNLSHEAVKYYRDTFRFCPNAGYRKDIVSTVTNMELWKTILGEWKANKWNFFKIGWLLSEYERRAQSGTNATIRSGRRRLSESSEVGIPRRRDALVSRVSEAERADYGRDHRTLEDILAQAMRQVPETS